MLLAEDHPLIRDAIAKIVTAEHDVIGIAERGDQLEQIAYDLQPNVLLLDISLPGLSGILALPRLRAILPETCIVMLTIHSDPLYREEAFRRGADGYVLKHSAPVELLPAVRNGFYSLLRSRRLQA